MSGSKSDCPYIQGQRHGGEMMLRIAYPPYILWLPLDRTTAMVQNVS